MSEPTRPDDRDTVAEIRAMTGRLRELVRRMAAGETVDQAELDAFEADKAELIGRLEGGAQ
jgi:hypothetical protein